jgi:hypothetical protein
MADSSNTVAIALLATLEEKAKKKGKKSIVKSVLRRLRAEGAEARLLIEVAALRADKAPKAEAIVEPKPSPKRAGGSKSRRRPAAATLNA